MKEEVVEKVAQGAVESLMRGDWTAYQRYLRGIPSQQEAALLKRIDELLKTASKKKQCSQSQ
jgi:hypothetical protein